MNFAAPESVKHGTSKKNIAFYYHDNGTTGIFNGTFAAHWHSEYEIAYVDSGSPSFFLNGKEQRLSAGEALIINKNVIHGCTSAAAPHTRFMCIVFGEQFVFSSTSDTLYEEYFLPVHVANKEFPAWIRGETEWEIRLLEIIKQLCASGRRPGCELEWRIHLLEMFLLAHTHDIFVEGRQTQSKNISTIRTALTFIEENYTEQISIPALAGEVGFSTEYFCRLFKLIVKKTPVEYIVERRIALAMHLLTHTADSITAIAIASGFNDVNYFSRCFKKKSGITAKQYRRMFS